MFGSNCSVSVLQTVKCVNPSQSALCVIRVTMGPFVPNDVLKDVWGIVVGLTTANATLVALRDSLGIHVAFRKMGLTCAKAPAFAQAIATDVKITRRIVWIATWAITINLAPISALTIVFA